MDPLDAIDALASRARNEVAPLTNTPISLLLRKASANIDPIRLRPLAWSAAVSALAACIALTLAIHFGRPTTSTTDSVSSLFNAANVEMP
jgi:hypothetical protein